MYTYIMPLMTTDPTLQKQAESQLETMAQQDLGQFLLLLCQVMADENKPIVNRQLAGLSMKNQVAGKDQTIAAQKKERWVAQCDPAVKEQIKNGMLQSLYATDRNVSHTAAQVVAAFAALEVPMGTWQAVVPALLNNVSQAQASDLTKTSSLEALGYLCESIEADSMEKSVVDQILNAIVQGMVPERSIDIQRAACQALGNALVFTEKNFAEESERNHIMAAIFAASASADAKMKTLSLECLLEVADQYYDLLQPYMQQVFELTTSAMQDSSVPDLARIAYEFWILVSEMESDRIEDGEKHFGLIAAVKTQLVTITLGTLVQKHGDGMQEDDDDDDDDIAASAALLLTCMAETLHDELNPLVLPAVYQGMNDAANPTWQMRYAALYAFKALLEGSREMTFQKTVAEAVPFILGLARNPVTQVRDAANHALSEICDGYITQVGPSAPKLVEVLQAGFQDQSPMVAASAIFCCKCLAEAFEDDAEEATGTVSTFLQPMIQALLAAASREDASEHNLRPTAYEAINSLIMSAPLDHKTTIFGVLSEACGRLTASFQGGVPGAQTLELQALLCGVVNVCVQRCEEAQVFVAKDQIMQIMISIFQSPATGGAQEEALNICGNMADKLGREFLKYMPHFIGFVHQGIGAFDQAELSTMAVMCVGDLCRALKKEMVPFADDIMSKLCALLQANTAKRQVKPHAISTFGDIAMAVEGKFTSYVEFVNEMLTQAGGMECASEDEDEIEYFNSLRESILYAYTSIIMGLAEENKHDVMLPHIPTVVSFAEKCYRHPHRSHAVLQGVVGILGDLADRYGAVQMAPLLKNQAVFNLLEEAKKRPDLVELAGWAQVKIKGE